MRGERGRGLWLALVVAAAAGVERLVLIHIYTDERFDDAELAIEARAHFHGEVVVATDGAVLELPAA